MPAPSEPEPSEAEPAIELTEPAIELVEAGTDAGEVRIGDRTISRALYDIFLSEADDLLATLAADAACWADEAARPATEAAQRAMHSLKGSAALVELHGVQSVADHLENFLLRQRASGRAMGAADLSDYARTVDRLQAMLHRFAAGNAPGDEPEALARACALALRWDSRNEVRVPPEPASADAPPANEFDEELLPIFVEEATDYLPQIGDNLRRWHDAPADRSLQQLLMRHLHTVKGSARMAGAMDLGQLVHEMETRIEAASVLTVVPTALIEELISDSDDAVEMFEAIRDPATRAAGATGGCGACPNSRRCGAHRGGDTRCRGGCACRDRGSIGDGCDRIAGAGAIAICSTGWSTSQAKCRSRVHGSTTSWAQMRQSLEDLTENVERLRTQMREIEIQAESQIQARSALSREIGDDFDPLEFDRFTRLQELTRMMAESVDDVATVQQSAMRKGLQTPAATCRAQYRLPRELQQHLMRVRMVQFRAISDRLYRVARQAGKELDKRVNVDIRGGRIEIDRGVLERMAGPFEHLVRNAIAHGIETPRSATRSRQARGRRICASRCGRRATRSSSSFADDGAGLDSRAHPPTRARRNGLLACRSEPSERELMDLIFAAGFSTATEVTRTGRPRRRPGRRALGAGRLRRPHRHRLEAGRGTRFTLHLPLTLARSRRWCWSRSAAAAMRFRRRMVEQVMRVKPQALADAIAEGMIDWQAARVQMHISARWRGLDDAADRRSSCRRSVILLRSGD